MHRKEVEHFVAEDVKKVGLDEIREIRFLRYFVFYIRAAALG